MDSDRNEVGLIGRECVAGERFGAHPPAWDAENRASGRRSGLKVCITSPFGNPPTPPSPAKRLATLLFSCSSLAFASSGAFSLGALGSGKADPDPGLGTDRPKSQTFLDLVHRLHGHPPRHRSFCFRHYHPHQLSLVTQYEILTRRQTCAARRAPPSESSFPLDDEADLLLPSYFSAGAESLRCRLCLI